MSTLREIHARSPQVFWALVVRPWLRDDLNNPELQVTLKILDVVDRAPGGALIVASMPFLDTLEGSELRMLEWLIDLSWNPRHLSALLGNPELADGIRDDDAHAVVRIILELQNPAAAAKIDALPWVLDGIDDSERALLHELRRAARSYAQSPLFDVLIGKPWVQDHLSGPEYGALYWLLDLSLSHESVARRVTEMPFLESVTHIDYLAVLGLYLVPSSDRTEYYERILSHPALVQGITDEQAVLFAVSYKDPGLLDVLLDPEQTVVETRRIEPPLGGEIVLSVVWPGSNATVARASRTMELLEHVVRTQEEFMGVQYPMRHAAVLVADVTAAAGGGGFLGNVTIDPPYFEDYALIAHEAAHTYWNVPPFWLQEGAATFLEHVSLRAWTGEPLPEPEDSCGSFDNLLEVEQAGIEGRICSYSLGAGVFLDLYRTIGDEAFRRGFAQLYERSRDRNTGDQCPRAGWSVCTLKAAFVTDASAEHAAASEAIIDRRYYGAGN